MGILANILVLVTAIIISTLAGVLIGTNTMRKTVDEGSVGYLRIDRSEEDEPPKAFLEIVGTSIEAISRKEIVILKVVNKNYISRD